VRAIEAHRFGGPDVLELRDVADPVPGPGQILVAAAACDVLFVDTMIRSGRGADYFPIRPPYVPGNGVGGTIVGLGAGIDTSWLGRSVVAHTGGAGGTGGYSELAAVDLSDCALVTDDVDLLDATAVLHDGTTALRILEKTVPVKGEWILILGAAGGMGLLLVQLAIPVGPMRCSTPAAGVFQPWYSTESAEQSAGKPSGWSPTVDASRRTGPRAARSHRLTGLRQSFAT
jgi:NADPH:quinone reductase